MTKPRVLVVDDTTVVRKLLTDVIEKDDELEMAGTAPNGKVALLKIPQVNPDIITLDIEMPELDGIETLKQIRMVDKRTPIIMLSSLTRTGAEKTFEALASGATDYLLKPSKIADFSKTIDELNQRLLPKLKLHVKSKLTTTSPSRAKIAVPTSKFAASRTNGPCNILCIGASTGGPTALETLFLRLTTPLPIPTVVVQHMPPLFTRTLAERLDKTCASKVVEGEHGQEIEPGHIYIAPGGKHMEVQRTGGAAKLHLHEGPPENSCRPAVDVLFHSVAKTFSDGALGVILTGMGKDGLRGCNELRSSGSRIISQDKDSSLIWGMPRAVTEANVAHEVRHLDDIANVIYTRLATHGPNRN